MCCTKQKNDTRSGNLIVKHLKTYFSNFFAQDFREEVSSCLKFYSYLF